MKNHKYTKLSLKILAERFMELPEVGYEITNSKENNNEDRIQ